MAKRDSVDPKRMRANRMLSRLPDAERRILELSAERVDMVVGAVLSEPGKKGRYVYFPHEGVISLTAPVALLEVALVGPEGMCGSTAATGGAVSPMRATVCGPGNAARITAASFDAALARCPMLRQALLVQAHALLHQAFQRIACNNRHSLGARLAQILLSRSDRLQAKTIAWTQASLASALGVQRPAVSGAASELQRQKIIAYRRGELTIVDRKRLIAAACACYAVTDRLYRTANR